ncbi:MAG: hypothetical protein Q7K29_04195 [Thermoleophilia bacterium]|nr:hypothetical protein [Thermoleophilia bacterium]
MRFNLLPKGKLLFYVAGFICLISIVLSPVGLAFVYMAITSHIIIDEKDVTYKMLRKYVIPLTGITGLTIGETKRPAYYVDDLGKVSFATVIPLTIDHEGKQTRLSLNYFQDPGGIIDRLREKTGLTVVNESGEDIPF